MQSDKNDYATIRSILAASVSNPAAISELAILVIAETARPDRATVQYHLRQLEIDPSAIREAAL